MDLFIWILIICGPIGGVSLVFFGIKANKEAHVPFHLKDLFFRTSSYEKSGTVMIIEGIAGIIASLLLFFYFN